MKKIVNICLSFLMFIVIAFSVICVKNQAEVGAEAFDKTDQQVYELIQKELVEFLQIKSSENSLRQGRIPGSDAEYNSAIYLKNKLSALKNFKSVTNASTVDGLESFEFECLFDGNMYRSQNVIFRREAIVNTDRKVVLATHYDMAYIAKEEGTYKDGGINTEGLNESAASIATLLALAKTLDQMPLDFGYDIEIVFFGASTNDYAGSKYYMRGHTDEMSDDILLMVNLDKIGVGEYNYIYMNEFETTQEKYVFKTIEGFKKLKQENTVDYSIESPNGLSYTHVGLESDHAIFMKKNVNVL